MAPSNRWRESVLLGGAVFGIGLLFVFEGQVLLVLFAGVLLGILLWTIAGFSVRFFHLGYRTSLAIVIAISVLSWAAALWLIGARIAIELKGLAARLPELLHSIASSLEHVPLLSGLFGLGRAGAPSPGPGALVTGTAGVVSTTLEVIAALVLTIFIGVYLAFSPKSYTRPLLSLVPSRRRELSTIMARVAHALGRWLIGRTIAMIFVGVSTALGLLVLGVPMSLGLGFLAGALAFIEYAGAVISAVPAVAIALGESLAKGISVSLVYLGAHIVEGYFLTPYLAKKSVHVPPAYTLAGQLVLGVLYGPLGLTFSTPLIVVGIVLIQALYDDKMARDARTGS